MKTIQINLSTEVQAISLWHPFIENGITKWVLITQILQGDGSIKFYTDGEEIIAEERKP